MSVTPDRWQEVERLYHAALERPEGERAAFLEQICAGDEALRQEVESLLSQPSHAGQFLETPAVEMAAGKLTENQTQSLVGHQLSSYKVLSLLGAGGMGEVYEAQDTKLGRKVAIKILPSAFVHDPERLSRFQREARMLAALNHPDIATIYGLEKSDGVHYLVMELVPGDTLAERINKGRLPADEALRIARQIAEALEAAHERGVIHRDLKPANVKVTPEGRVKVLDFGLAKAFSGDGGQDLSQGPTLSEEGRILGTPAYMSPEQARGKPVDKQTDIWAFGCVLYELLAGKQAFGGETLSDIIAAILGREPDWQALSATTPANIRFVLRRCLQKEKHSRFRDCADVRIEIEETLAAPAELSRAFATTSATGSRQVSWRAATATAVLSAVLTGTVIWNLNRPIPRAPRSVARLVLPVSPGVDLFSAGSSMALSPDGTRLAYVADHGGATQLYLRAIEGMEATVLPGTQGASLPFFSPDGQWIGFFAEEKLKKISTTGGLPVILCSAGGGPRGGTWGQDTIIFAVARGSGLLQVSADGGTPQPITTLDSSKGETGHRLPELLPDGKTILFAAYGATYSDVAIVAQSLQTGERRVLIEGASQPRYSPSGFLLYVQPDARGTVMAVSFDPKTLTLTGNPVSVVQGVRSDRGDAATWSFSRDGMLAYVPGGTEGAGNNLVWVNRKGMAEPLAALPRRPYQFPRLSPDGRRIVVAIHETQLNLWIYDRARHTFTRLTFKGNNNWPVWTPDGTKVTYASNRAEPWNLFWKRADGSGNEELLLAAPKSQVPLSWSRDGKFLAFLRSEPETGLDVWVVQLEGTREPRPLLKSSAQERDATFSPDGHWLAYTSNESGRDEVYVLSFPSLGGKWQVSTEGGAEPVWNTNGRELFYRSGDKMMAVATTTQPTFSVGESQMLFERPYVSGLVEASNYDVSPDGQRFLMVKESEDAAPATQINVVLNWTEELKRLVAAGTK